MPGRREKGAALINVTDADALIAVDIQNDFLEGGSLGVNEGHRVLPIVNALTPLFRHVVLTRDWHPADHTSFSHDPRYADGSWPRHAVADTLGSAFPPSLNVPAQAFIVSKATQPDREEYSGFQATGTDLTGWLHSRGVRRVFLAGIATDYCVRFTALDAAREGFEVLVIEDAVRGVSPQSTAVAWRVLEEAGVGRVLSSELTRAGTPGRG